MTETAATVVATETVAPRVQRRALAGVLSNIETVTVGETTLVLASLISTYLGKENVYSLSISSAVLPNVENLLVEGQYARFYGEIGESFVTVLGPDLTKRTLARQAAKAESEAAPVPAAKKAKRPMTEKQMNTWNTVILPKLQAGRAAKAAERAAAKAEPVAA